MLWETIIQNILKSRELHFKYNLETVFLYTDVPQKKIKNYDLSLAAYM